jgi:CxxC motif-containing protein (DUF1111 family)
VYLSGPNLLAVTRIVLCLALAVPSLAGNSTEPKDMAALRDRGQALFTSRFTPEQGLGPLYNGVSCIGCHSTPTVGGMGTDGLGIVTRVGRLTSTGFDAMAGHGGPVARAHSIAELGSPCDAMPGIPATANVTSVRNAPALYGAGLIDTIPDDEIEAGAISRDAGVHGRPHKIAVAGGGTRIGRFGWKADTATLREFVANAFRNELGITSPLAPFDLVAADRSVKSHCLGDTGTLEDNGEIVEAVTAFVASLPPPVSHQKEDHRSNLFDSTGCSACHRPSMSAGDRRVWLYSDLLLHDLGRDLDDQMVQGQASGHDWRTTPLWGLGTRSRFLHDGRARSISDAISAHGGEATDARRRFLHLSKEDRVRLLHYLAGL